MRHKITRIVIGAIMFIVGVVVLVQGNLEWWNGVLFLLVGAAFLFSAFKINTQK